jgi:hypothetical protein
MSLPHTFRVGRSGGGGVTLFDFSSATFYSTTQTTADTGPGIGDPRFGSPGPVSLGFLSSPTKPQWAPQYFTTNPSGVQIFTVPEDGSYTISADGSGCHQQSRSQSATAQGTFTLEAEEKLLIIPGRMGENRPSPEANSGGNGGSFVAKAPSTWPNTATNLNSPQVTLLVAGGGAGGRSQTPGTDNIGSSVAQTGTSGGNGLDPSGNNAGSGYSGGTNGGAGEHNLDNGNGKAGAGWLSRRPGTHPGPGYPVQVEGGYARDNSMQGGNGYSDCQGYLRGGFGGGGGGSGNGCEGASGGGGGYSGGGGGQTCCQGHGGGGGSYVNPIGTSPQLQTGDFNRGEVVVTKN